MRGRRFVALLATAGLMVGVSESATVASPDPGAGIAAKKDSKTKKAKKKPKVGRLKVKVARLPQNLTPQVTVTGKRGFTKTLSKTTTLTKLPVGVYGISAVTATNDNWTYTPRVKPKAKVKVRAGKLTRARVSFYSRYSGPTPTPPVVVAPPKYDIKDAAGVAVPSGAAGSGSHLRAAVDAPLLAVDANGALRSAIESGGLQPNQYIASTHAGPDGSLYIGYGGSSNTGTCMLAKVDRVTGVQTCIAAFDPSAPGTPSASARGTSSSAVQFDRSGRLYYSGTTSLQGTYYYYIRRVDGGQTTELFNLANVGLPRWVVAADGTLVVEGSTFSTGQRWLRAISPSGAVRNLGVPVMGQVMPLATAFPDGNVYLAWSDHSTSPAQQGVRRYLVDQGTLDPRFWIAGAPDVTDPTWDCAAIGGAGACNALLGIASVAVTPAGKVWGLTGATGGARRLVQLYPEFKVANPTVTPLALAAVGERLAVSGIDAAQRQVTVLYDPTADSDRVLLGADNEVEVFRLNYSEPAGVVMFDGLRYADGRYVVGSINPQSGGVTMDTSGRLAQFITLR